MRNVGELLDLAVTLTVRLWAPLGAIAGVVVAVAFASRWALLEFMYSHLRGFSFGLGGWGTLVVRSTIERSVVELVRIAIGAFGLMTAARFADGILHGVPIPLGLAVRDAARVWQRAARAFAAYGIPLAAAVAAVSEAWIIFTFYSSTGVALRVAALSVAQLPVVYFALVTYAAFVDAVLGDRAGKLGPVAFGLLTLRAWRLSLPAALVLMAIALLDWAVPYTAQTLGLDRTAVAVIYQVFKVPAAAITFAFVTVFYRDLKDRACGNDRTIRASPEPVAEVTA